MVPLNHQVWYLSRKANRNVPEGVPRQRVPAWSSFLRVPGDAPLTNLTGEPFLHSRRSSWIKCVEKVPWTTNSECGISGLRHKAHFQNMCQNPWTNWRVITFLYSSIIWEWWKEQLFITPPFTSASTFTRWIHSSGTVPFFATYKLFEQPSLTIRLSLPAAYHLPPFVFRPIHIACYFTHEDRRMLDLLSVTGF